MKKNKKVLLYTSCLTSFSIYFSYKNNFHLVCRATSLLLFTSINYWRKPEHGFRRNMDRLVVVVNLPIELICFRKSKRYYIYLLLTGISSLCYFIASKSKNQKISTLFHSFIHIFANVGNCLAMN
jgi:hypothetical protein